MIALRYQFNAVMTELIEGQRPRYDCVPVLKKDGDFVRVNWLGFIDLGDARGIKGARPVKLDIRAYSVSPTPWPKWIYLSENEAIQGCLTGNGVYAVVKSGMPRIVETCKNKPITN